MTRRWKMYIIVIVTKIKIILLIFGNKISISLSKKKKLIKFNRKRWLEWEHFWVIFTASSSNLGRDINNLHWGSWWLSSIQGNFQQNHHDCFFPNTFQFNHCHPVTGLITKNNNFVHMNGHNLTVFHCLPNSGDFFI